MHSPAEPTITPAAHEPARRGPGRPAIGKRHQVRLDAATSELFTRLGGGSLSEGLREGARRLAAAGLDIPTGEPREVARRAG